MTTFYRLGFAFHRYQDRLPEWARRPAKKPVKRPASQQQPHLEKHLQQLEGGAHDKLAKDIQVLGHTCICQSKRKQSGVRISHICFKTQRSNHPHAQETCVREQTIDDNSAPPGLGKGQTSRQQGTWL